HSRAIPDATAPPGLEKQARSGVKAHAGSGIPAAPARGARVAARLRGNREIQRAEQDRQLGRARSVGSKNAPDKVKPSSGRGRTRTKAIGPGGGLPRSVVRFSKSGLQSAIAEANGLTSGAGAMRYALTTGAQIKMQKVNAAVAARRTALTLRAERVRDALTI